MDHCESEKSRSMQACSSSSAQEQAISDSEYQYGDGDCESSDQYEPNCHRRRISCEQDDQMQCDDYAGEAEYEGNGGDFGLPALNNFITRISSTEIFDEPSVKAKFVGPYFVSARMGSGSYATVKECVDSRTLQRFAIKILAYRKGRKIPTFEQDIRSEIRLLSRLHHPNVIRLFDILEKRKPEDFKKYLVLTYCIADMQHILENARGHKFPEYQAQRYFRQTCDGLEYLHAVGVIHKDIKPGNLLIAPDDTVRITDFGVAELLSGFAPDDRIQRSAGTIAFQPPEVFNSTEDDSYPGFKLDVWSLGVTLYNITSGCLPFEIGSDPGAMFRLMTVIGKANWRLPDGLSAHLGQLISRMMDSNVAARCTLAEVKRSDWFIAQLPCVGDYVNPNIGRLQDAGTCAVEMFTEPDGTRTVAANALSTYCRMSVLDHLDVLGVESMTQSRNLCLDSQQQQQPASRKASNTLDPGTQVKRTLTSEDIEKEMRGGERKANQLYAQMNLKDDDLDEDTAEAFMFTIRQRTSVADDDEPRTSTADNHLPAVNELTIANEVFANSNGVDNRMDDAAAQATQVDNHDASPSKTAQEEKDDKSNKKGRQKKSPRAPSFCKLS